MFQFIRQLFSRTKPETDLSYGLITNLGVEPLLAQQQWNTFESKATQLATDDLTRLLDGLCLTTRYAPALTTYLAAGSSELRTLVAAVRATFLAWESRGAMVATETGEQQFDGFFHYLNQAFELLNQPFQTPLLEAEVGARMVRVAMGLSEAELAADAFSACTDLSPNHLMGHYNYLRVVSPWWLGSLETLQQFVESIADPTLYQLFRLIHLHEVNSYLQHEHNSTALAKELLQRDYRAQLAAALAGPPVAEGTTLAAIYYNNYLAALHHLLGNAAARNPLLLALGPHIMPLPWSYFGLEAASVRKLSTANR
jgi:hypothetical protein